MGRTDRTVENRQQRRGGKISRRAWRSATGELDEASLAATAGCACDWRPFVDHYDPKMNFTELDCLFGQYQLISGQKEQGYATAEKLWLVGKSQHNACDAL